MAFLADALSRIKPSATIAVTNKAVDGGGSTGSGLVMTMDGVGPAKVGVPMSRFAAALGYHSPAASRKRHSRS